MDFFLQSRSERSKRHGVVELEGSTAYLYLTAAGESRPERDVVAFCVGPLVPLEIAREEARRGNPPSLTIEHASESALICAPSTADFDLRWSEDGESVVLDFKGEPWALVSSKMVKGSSRAVEVSGPIGNAWSEGDYVLAFRAEA